MLEIKLADSAPISKRTYYKIAVPTWLKPIKGIPVSEGYIPLWTHWIERSLICTNTKACPHCRRKISRRWKGFIPSCDLTRRVLFIAEITPPIARRIDALYSQQVSLTTIRYTLRRSRDAKNAPQAIDIEHLTEKELQIPLPKTFNALPTILSTLGLGDEDYKVIQ